MRTQLFVALLALAACGDDNKAAPTVDGPTETPIDAPTDQPDSPPPPGTIVKVTPLSATGHDRLYGAAYDGAGNIYAVGQIADGTDATTDYASLVVKFKPTGELDTTFGTGGIARTNVAVGTNGELFRGIVVTSTGKIVISGNVEHAGAADARDRDIALVRYNADGTLDTTFGTNGVAILDLSTGVVSGTSFVADSVWGLAAYADGRLAISAGKVRTGATDTDFAVVRLTAAGAYDTTFGTNGVFSLDLDNRNASPRNIELLPGTQGIVAAGYQPIAGRDTEPVVYKLTNAGALDTTFGDGGVFDDFLLDEQAESYVARAQGDKLVTTGYGRKLETDTTDILSFRLTATGTLDPTYGTNGMTLIDVGGFADNSRNLAVLPDQRVLLSGGGRPTDTNVDGWIGLLTKDGALDTTFSPTGYKTIDLGGPADFLWSLAVAPDAKTAAFVGFKGVGNGNPGNDDAAIVILPL